MTVSELKKLLDYLEDDMEVVVGCEGYCNYRFEEDSFWDGDDGKTKVTRIGDVVVLHARDDNPYDYR